MLIVVGLAGLVVGAELLILGLSALISPIALDPRTVRFDLPLMAAEYDDAYPPKVAGPRAHRPWRDVASLLVGIAVIVAGAARLVDGAVDAARSLGVSDAIIGLTIIAVGTSAPELVTTVLSTIRGNRDIALGNLLGSSVYNIAVILGITILVALTRGTSRRRSVHLAPAAP